MTRLDTVHLHFQVRVTLYQHLATILFACHLSIIALAFTSSLLHSSYSALLQKTIELIQSYLSPKVRVTLFILVLVGIAVLSLKPTPTTLIELNGFDKVQHAMAYLVLGLCAATIIKATRLHLVFTILWLLSGMVEVLQSMQAARQGSIYDWIANGVGLLLAYGVAYLIAKAVKSRAT